MRLAFFTCLTAVLLAACAASDKHDHGSAALTYSGKGRVNVAVHDRRPNVVNDNSEQNRVGRLRSRFGISRHLATASGHPLAQDLTESLQHALDEAGFETANTTIYPNESEATARSRVLAGAPRRALLLRIDRWDIDARKNPTLSYDLTLDLYDARGERLTTRTLKGSDDLSGEGLIRDAKKTQSDVLDRKIGELLNAPDVRGALAN